MLKGFVSGVEKDIVRIPMKGRNLLNLNRTYSNSFTTDTAKWMNGAATMNDTGTVYAETEILGDVVRVTSKKPGYGVSFLIEASPNTTYTVSFETDKASSGSWGGISDRDINGTVISQAAIQGKSAAFTTHDNCAFLNVCFRFPPADGTVTFSNIMLSLGSIALPYEPYGYQEGWEVRDNQDRLIWGREDEFQTATGTLPFKGYGLPVKVKSLLGNTQQSGTPTPDAPIMPTFCGVRTAQLWNAEGFSARGITSTHEHVDTNTYGTTLSTTTGKEVIVTQSAYPTGNAGYQNGFFFIDADFSKYEIGDKVTLSFDYIVNEVHAVSSQTSTTIYAGKTSNSITPTLSSGDWKISGRLSVVITIITDMNPYVEVRLCGNSITVKNIMLNTGTEPLPYEPYGWAEKITCAGQTVPVYLGQVSTVRKIRKLVLTGTENWNEGTFNYYVFINVSGRYEGIPNSAAMSTHTESGVVVNNNGAALFFRKSVFAQSSLADFKSYLASEYAAGRPVTIWYVLANEQTGIINEPLCKIGDYADELNDTVATLPEIPTTTGQNTLTVDTTLAPSSLTISVHAKNIHYGFKIDKSVENSEDAVIYTHDAVTMTPAHMDFTNDRFDYGSWDNAFFVRDCYPVALNLDGTEAYRLDPDDYTKKSDGTPSDIFYELLATEPSDWSTQWKQYYTRSGDEYVLNSQDSAPTFATDTYYKLTYNSSFTGNFMMAFPKVWFYRYEDPKYNYIEISNHKLSDDWKCYAHINANGQQVDFIYLPLFKGVIKDSKLRSLPGQIPQGDTTATTEVNAATALGSRWQIWDHSSVECLNDLLTLMSKSIDSQGRFGQGRSEGYNSTDTVTYGKLQTGTLIKKGKFHGYGATTKEVKVFGIEGFWANRLDRLQGMLLVNNVWKIKMTPPYNFTGTDFVTLSNAEVPTGNGYLSKVQSSEYGSIPASIANGSSTKYFKDYFYKTATDTRVALRGGYCNYGGGNTGFRHVNVYNAASSSAWGIGASPVYK